MSTLIAVGYDTPFKAEEIRMKLQQMQKAYLIDLEDAVVAIKNAKGKIKLDQQFNLTALGAARGGFWGALIGMLFLNPFFGLAVGVAAGAVGGALRDVGINDKFMKDLAETLKPNTSALFVLVRKATPDRVLDELKGTGGKILQSSLSHEEVDRLQGVLAEAA
jgi:uncharacterized membrane protein